MSSLPKRHSKLKRSTDIFLKAGLPLVLFIIAGSYGLSVFMRTHYEYKDKKDKSITVRNFDLEEEHRKTMEKVICHKTCNQYLSRGKSNENCYPSWISRSIHSLAFLDLMMRLQDRIRLINLVAVKNQIVLRAHGQSGGLASRSI